MTSLFIGIFTGAVGVGYMMYGRRQARYTPFVSGLLLCVYTYFVSGWLWLGLIGAILLAAPFVIDL